MPTSSQPKLIQAELLLSVDDTLGRNIPEKIVNQDGIKTRVAK